MMRMAVVILSMLSTGAALAEVCAPPSALSSDPRAAGMVPPPGGAFVIGSQRRHAEVGPQRRVKVAATGRVTMAECGRSAEEAPHIPADLRAPGSMVAYPPRDPVGLDDPTRCWRYVRGAN